MSIVNRSILRAFTADVFWAGACRNYISLTKARERQSYGNGNLLKVHSDKRSADIYAGMRADMLDRSGGGETLVASGGKGASRLWNGTNRNLVKRETLEKITLYNDGSVKMLAALCGKKYALFVKDWKYTVEYCIGNRRNRCFSYSVARNLG